MTMSRWDDRGFLITDRLRSARLPSWTFGQLRIAIFGRGCARSTGPFARRNRRGMTTVRRGYRTVDRAGRQFGKRPAVGSRLPQSRNCRAAIYRYWPKVQCVTEIHIRPLAVANPTQSPTLVRSLPPSRSRRRKFVTGSSGSLCSNTADWPPFGAVTLRPRLSPLLWLGRVWPTAQIR